MTPITEANRLANLRQTARTMRGRADAPNLDPRTRAARHLAATYAQRHAAEAARTAGR